jgi:phosphohistidine phosphatase
MAGGCLPENAGLTLMEPPAQDEALLIFAMVVYFLRHAEAEPDFARDFDRRLTAKGLEQAEKVGKFFVRYGLIPEVIISSPVVRAWQTAKIVAQKLGDAKIVDGPWLACGMNPGTCLQELAAYVEKSSVLLVGHEPDFGETIARLIGLHDATGIKVRKASLTAVDLPRLAPGNGELQFSVPARLM